MANQHWFRWWLGDVRQHVIIWINIDQVFVQANRFTKGQWIDMDIILCWTTTKMPMVFWRLNERYSIITNGSPFPCMLPHKLLWFNVLNAPQKFYLTYEGYYARLDSIRVCHSKHLIKTNNSEKYNLLNNNNDETLPQNFVLWVGLFHVKAVWRFIMMGSGAPYATTGRRWRI